VPKSEGTVNWIEEGNIVWEGLKYSVLNTRSERGETQDYHLRHLLMDVRGGNTG